MNFLTKPLIDWDAPVPYAYVEAVLYECIDGFLMVVFECRAIKNGKGLHSKKEVPIHRVADISGVCIYLLFLIIHIHSSYAGK